MIVRDEEATLARCLDSIKDIVDEINIIDTGSCDHTKEIAKQYTNRIYDFEWVDDFSIARNYSFTKATKEYIMWLDADDIVLLEDQVKLKKLKEELSDSIDTVILKYNLTSKESGEIISSFYRERVVKRVRNFQWQEPVHEYILFSGDFRKYDIAITHKKMHPPTRRNLAIFEKYLNNGKTLSPRNWFYYARELSNFQYYEKAAEYYEKFLDTNDAVVSNYLDSCVELSKYYILNNEQDKALKTLLRYFEKDGPRAEICCRIGSYYKDLKDYKKAISWYEIAPNTLKPDSLGSLTLSYWDYIPYMELCSCYYRIGQIDKAIYYNEKAAVIYPDDKKICHNRTYLSVAKQKLLNLDDPLV